MVDMAVHTFGGFDIMFGGKALSDASMRRGKAWAALKYLIAHHKRPVSADELIEVLWPDESCVDPANSLKNVIYRLRKLLAGYGDERYISFSQGSYAWIADCFIDSADFERAIFLAGSPGAGGEREELYKRAILLYKGEYMRGESDELGLVNFVNYYRRMFLGAVESLARAYEERMAYDEAVQLFAEALKVEPYEEALYERQIRLLINLGDYALARRQYQTIERLLKKEFMAEPSPALRGLRLELSTSKGTAAADLSMIKTSLDHEQAGKGAILCGPETFKRIYSYDKRLYERMGLPAFLGMVTVSADDGGVTLKQAMAAIRRIMLSTLRHSDIVCQYSENQFVLMLTVNDEKNKLASLHRVKRLFEKEALMPGVGIMVQAVAMGDDNQ